MALQKEILTDNRDLKIKVAGVEKDFRSATAAVVGGIPGKIADMSYGPLVMSDTLEAAAEIGTYVTDKGVLVNAPEYALKGGLTPSLTVAEGADANFMVAGHVWVKRGKAATILANMNGRIISEVSDDDVADDLCVVEVNGFVGGRTYTVTVTSSDTTKGTVTGGGTYAKYATATLKATPKTGCRFLQWSDGNTEATRTINVVSDRTLVAQFAYEM